MADETEKKEPRVKVEDIPEEEQELRAEEAKSVEGGGTIFVGSANGGVWKTTNGGSS